MSGRAYRDAIDDYRASVQQVLATVTQAVVVTRRDSRITVGNPITLIFNAGERIRLASPERIYLEASQWCIAVSPSDDVRRQWALQVSSYIYRVSTHDGVEILAFHWHPDGHSHVIDPHLHIGPASIGTNAQYRPGTMHNAHFPTGSVPLASVIRMAIEELGVEPRRPDWDAILRFADR